MYIACIVFRGNHSTFYTWDSKVVMRNLYGDSCEGNNYGDNWEDHCFKIILYPSCLDGILEIICLTFSEGTEMVHWIQIA